MLPAAGVAIPPSHRPIDDQHRTKGSPLTRSARGPPARDRNELGRDAQLVGSRGERRGGPVPRGPIRGNSRVVHGAAGGEHMVVEPAHIASETMAASRRERPGMTRAAGGLLALFHSVWSDSARCRVLSCWIVVDGSALLSRLQLQRTLYDGRRSQVFRAKALNGLEVALKLCRKRDLSAMDIQRVRVIGGLCIAPLYK